MEKIRINTTPLYNKPDYKMEKTSSKLEKAGYKSYNLNHSLQNLSGKQLAFGYTEHKHRLSSRFSEEYGFPAYKKIPDGFKFVNKIFSSKRIPVKIDKKGICNVFDEDEQITVIDRKKDKDLQKIIREHKNQVLHWKKEHVFMPRTATDEHLADKTMEFVNSYSKKEPFDVIEQELDKKFKRKETLLGEIIKSGLGVCRHKAFLNKILLDNIGIKTSVEFGNVFDDKLSLYRGHAWNTTILEKEKKVLDQGENFSTSNNEELIKYADIESNHLCSPPENFIDLQPTQSVKIGINKDGKTVPLKKDNEIKPVIELRWTEDNKFELNTLDEQTPVIFTDEFGTFHTKSGIININKRTFISVADHKKFFLFEGNHSMLCIDPDLIRANYLRKIAVAIKQIRKENHYPDLNFSYLLDELTQANPELSLKSLEQLSKPAFKNMRSISV